MASRNVAESVCVDDEQPPAPSAVHHGAGKGLIGGGEQRKQQAGVPIAKAAAPGAGIRAVGPRGRGGQGRGQLRGARGVRARGSPRGVRGRGGARGVGLGASAAASLTQSPRSPHNPARGQSRGTRGRGGGVRGGVRGRGRGSLPGGHSPSAAATTGGQSNTLSVPTLEAGQQQRRSTGSLMTDRYASAQFSKPAPPSNRRARTPSARDGASSRMEPAAAVGAASGDGRGRGRVVRTGRGGQQGGRGLAASLPIRGQGRGVPMRGNGRGRARGRDLSASRGPNRPVCQPAAVTVREVAKPAAHQVVLKKAVTMPLLSVPNVMVMPAVVTPPQPPRSPRRPPRRDEVGAEPACPSLQRAGTLGAIPLPKSTSSAPLSPRRGSALPRYGEGSRTEDAPASPKQMTAPVAHTTVSGPLLWRGPAGGTHSPATISVTPCQVGDGEHSASVSDEDAGQDCSGDGEEEEEEEDVAEVVSLKPSLLSKVLVIRRATLLKPTPPQFQAEPSAALPSCAPSKPLSRSRPASPMTPPPSPARQHEAVPGEPKVLSSSGDDSADGGDDGAIEGVIGGCGDGVAEATAAAVVNVGKPEMRLPPHVARRKLERPASIHEALDAAFDDVLASAAAEHEGDATDSLEDRFLEELCSIVDSAESIPPSAAVFPGNSDEEDSVEEQMADATVYASPLGAPRAPRRPNKARVRSVVLSRKLGAIDLSSLSEEHSAEGQGSEELADTMDDVSLFEEEDDGEEGDSAVSFLEETETITNDWRKSMRRSRLLHGRLPLQAGLTRQQSAYYSRKQDGTPTCLELRSWLQYRRGVQRLARAKQDVATSCIDLVKYTSRMQERDGLLPHSRAARVNPYHTVCPEQSAVSKQLEQQLVREYLRQPAKVMIAGPPQRVNQITQVLVSEYPRSTEHYRTAVLDAFAAKGQEFMLAFLRYARKMRLSLLSAIKDTLAEEVLNDFGGTDNVEFRITCLVELWSATAIQEAYRELYMSDQTALEKKKDAPAVSFVFGGMERLAAQGFQVKDEDKMVLHLLGVGRVHSYALKVGHSDVDLVVMSELAEKQMPIMASLSMSGLLFIVDLAHGTVWKELLQFRSLMQRHHRRCPVLVLFTSVRPFMQQAQRHGALAEMLPLYSGSAAQGQLITYLDKQFTEGLPKACTMFCASTTDPVVRAQLSEHIGSFCGQLLQKIEKERKEHLHTKSRSNTVALRKNPSRAAAKAAKHLRFSVMVKDKGIDTVRSAIGRFPSSASLNPVSNHYDA